VSLDLSLVTFVVVQSTCEEAVGEADDEFDVPVPEDDLSLDTTDTMLITFLPVSRRRRFGSPVAPRCFKSLLSRSLNPCAP
jgi:hypothetical protein